MPDDLEGLIERLPLWSAHGDATSPRDAAIAALRERGPDVVPLLVGRLDELLAATAGHRERVAAVQKVWTAWYEESDRLADDHGLMADVERYRAIPTESLPQRAPEDEHFTDPVELKQGIVEALRRFGDDRAGPVLTRALGDAACVAAAARVLRDIHVDGAVPALLDAAAAHPPDDRPFDDVVETLRHYGVTRARARERFEAETSPQGRVSLMGLLSKLPDDGTRRPAASEIRDSLVFLALDDKDSVRRWHAVQALNEMDNLGAETDFRMSAMEAPPSADVIGAAIVMAATGKPPGYDLELILRIRRLTHTPAGARAVEAVLTQDSPAPDGEVLDFALRLVLGVHTTEIDDPMGLVRALYRLSGHEGVGDRARRVLRRGDLLFTRMTQDDAAAREEARAIFDAVAEPADRARFARYAASRRGRWSKLLRPFGRG